jgi:1-aminocyclopropane-1-carboxylate deaminase/D-cysteine desulfhydrase-like pyridoxal-dependent ACC family enzyme
LDALPRLGLVREPTALFHAPCLSAAMGGPQLLFKRDDLLPVAFGGNKVRSLDLIVAEALRHGADTLVTGAGPLSNHVRASAGVADLTGLRWEIVHDDDISLAQRRREKMFDISAETCAVHRPIEHAGRGAARHRRMSSSSSGHAAQRL